MLYLLLEADNCLLIEIYLVLHILNGLLDLLYLLLVLADIVDFLLVEVVLLITQINSFLQLSYFLGQGIIRYGSRTCLIGLLKESLQLLPQPLHPHLHHLRHVLQRQLILIAVLEISDLGLDEFYLVGVEVVLGVVPLLNPLYLFIDFLEFLICLLL